MKVDKGHFDVVSLDNVKWAVAYHWPGPLHEGNGTVKPYFDTSTQPEQLNALAQILTGQAGGGWFEMLSTIVTEVKQPAIVDIDFEFSSKNGTIGDAIENRFAAIKNPVTGDKASIQVRIPGGLEYSDQGEAEIVCSEVMRSSDEIVFDYSGCHTSLVEQQTFGSHR